MIVEVSAVNGSYPWDALKAARAEKPLIDRLRRGPVGPRLSTASLTVKGPAATPTG